MTAFDLQRAILYEEADPHALKIDKFIRLDFALQTEQLAGDTEVAVAVFGGHTIAVPLLALLYHHTAQGIVDEQEWLMSFCALCNSGAVFSPLVDGKSLHFAGYGFYHAMVLLGDDETQSYWNHITGECLHGVLSGKRLERLANLLQMRANKVLAAYPDAQLLVPDFDNQATAIEWNRLYRLAEIPPHEDDEELVATFAQDDSRLPRYDVGLGLWGKTTRRYYPILKIHDANNALIDSLEGENILIYVDEEGGLPMAFYTEAKSFSRIGDSLHLDNGQIFRDGALYQGTERVKLRYPSQQAMRWYGFAALFPNCEIYAQQAD